MKLEKPGGGRPVATELRAAESGLDVSMSGIRWGAFSECCTGGGGSKVEAEIVNADGWSGDTAVAAVAEGVREPKASNREPGGGLN
jgi:hypothetical protein